MASEGTHLQQANRNQSVLERLIDDRDPPSDWITVVAFYKAVHVVEAVLSCQEAAPNNHSVDHKSRNKILKTKYTDIWKSYFILYRNSLVARYLEYGPPGQTTSFSAFASFMPHQRLMDEALAVDLVRVEAESLALLSGFHPLVCYADGKAEREPPTTPPSQRFTTPPASKSSQ